MMTCYLLQGNITSAKQMIYTYTILYLYSQVIYFSVSEWLVAGCEGLLAAGRVQQVRLTPRVNP